MSVFGLGGACREWVSGGFCQGLKGWGGIMHV